MSMGKKKNDATKKKGMALSADALDNVTGGTEAEYCEYSPDRVSSGAAVTAELQIPGIIDTTFAAFHRR